MEWDFDMPRSLLSVIFLGQRNSINSGFVIVYIPECYLVHGSDTIC